MHATAYLDAPDFACAARDPRDPQSVRDWRPRYPLGYTPRALEALPRADLKPQQSAGPRAALPAPAPGPQPAPLHARALTLDLAVAQTRQRARARQRAALERDYRAAVAPPARAPRRPTVADRLLALLADCTPRTCADIARTLGIASDQVQRAAVALHRAGRLIREPRPNRGARASYLYRLAPDDTSSPASAPAPSARLDP